MSTRTQHASATQQTGCQDVFVGNERDPVNLTELLNSRVQGAGRGRGQAITPIAPGPVSASMPCIPVPSPFLSTVPAHGCSTAEEHTAARMARSIASSAPYAGANVQSQSMSSASSSVGVPQSFQPPLPGCFQPTGAYPSSMSSPTSPIAPGSIPYTMHQVSPASGAVMMPCSAPYTAQNIMPHFTPWSTYPASVFAPAPNMQASESLGHTAVQSSPMSNIIQGSQSFGHAVVQSSNMMNGPV